jgi:Protein of unknown function (DUF3078)
MKKIVSLLMGLALFYLLNAQDVTVKNLQKESGKEIKKDNQQKEGWTRGASINIGLAQGGSSNWAAGAERFSFSTNLIASGFTSYKKGRHTWDNSLDIQYAFLNTTSQGYRKVDDRIDLVSRYGYQLDNPKWYFTMMGNFRTQFVDGRRYFKSDATGADTSERISAFMAPAYVLLSPGFQYKPSKFFDISLSPASGRLIIVANRPAELGKYYGVNPNLKARSELGAFINANFNKELFKNVTVKSRLDLFSNYRNNPQNVDVFWTTLITMKVNKWLNVTYNYDMIYDDDAVRPGGQKWGTQLKSLLGIGFGAKF